MTQPHPYQGLGTFSPKVRSSSVVRKQVSQNGAGELGLRIVGPNSELTDADTVSLTLYRDADFDNTNAYEDEHPYGDVIRQWAADEIGHEDTGLYWVQIGPRETAERGALAAVWTYTVGSETISYTDYLEVREYMPTFDALAPHEKVIVEQVSWMFADLFDSTNGGPHLMEPFQSHFNFERIAQLMGVAVNRMNTQGVPLMGWELGIPGTTGQQGAKMPDNMDGLLMMGTYLEVLLHLSRSYIEQPIFSGMNVTYTDRRSYSQEWKRMYDDEKRAWDRNLVFAKRQFLGLGRGSLIVAGGIYGRRGHLRSGTYAMQLRAFRFYPISSVILKR